MKIGVDVGGTNTDAVVLGPGGVLGWHKTPTTEDVFSGIVEAISAAVGKAGIDISHIDCVMIGTTQFTNAVIERRSLLPVGVLRICLPAASAIPPLSDWPADLAKVVGDHVNMVGGGFEFDGQEIAPLDEAAVGRVAKSMRKTGLRRGRVVSVERE